MWPGSFLILHGLAEIKCNFLHQLVLYFKWHLLCGVLQENTHLAQGLKLRSCIWYRAYEHTNQFGCSTLQGLHFFEFCGQSSWNWAPPHTKSSEEKLKWNKFLFYLWYSNPTLTPLTKALFLTTTSFDAVCCTHNHLVLAWSHTHWFIVFSFQRWLSHTHTDAHTVGVCPFRDSGVFMSSQGNHWWSCTDWYSCSRQPMFCRIKSYEQQ